MIALPLFIKLSPGQKSDNALDTSIFFYQIKPTALKKEKSNIKRLLMHDQIRDEEPPY